jgi:hypothetical protein
MLSDSNTLVERRPQRLTRLIMPTTPPSPDVYQRDRRPNSHNSHLTFTWKGCEQPFDSSIHPVLNVLHYDVLKSRTLDNSQFLSYPSDFAERLHQNFPQAVQNPTKHSRNVPKLSSALRRSKRRAKSASVFYDDS